MYFIIVLLSDLVWNTISTRSCKLFYAETKFIEIENTYVVILFPLLLSLIMCSYDLEFEWFYRLIWRS